MNEVIRQIFNHKSYIFKGALSGPRQFLATESSLKTMKNTLIAP